jgi:hypothetical protein
VFISPAQQHFQKMPSTKKNQSHVNYGATSLTGSNLATHMQTCMAGEDASRLAEMAHDFGLQQQRKPRNQVRERVNVPLKH